MRNRLLSEIVAFGTVLIVAAPYLVGAFVFYLMCSDQKTQDAALRVILRPFGRRLPHDVEREKLMKELLSLQEGRDSKQFSTLVRIDEVKKSLRVLGVAEEELDPEGRARRLKMIFAETCATLRTKKIVDLSVQDAETLRTCGVQPGILRAP